MFKRIALAAAVAVFVGMTGCSGDTGPAGPTGATGATGAGGATGASGSSPADAAAAFKTATPIKHLVVIFGENISFDHYFGTYPYDVNPTSGAQTLFSSTAKDPGGINNYIKTPTLLTANANGPSGTGASLNNGAPATADAGDKSASTITSGGAVNPFVLPRAAAATEDQDHDYPDEQLAFDGGLMDLFPYYVGVGGAYSATSTNASASAPAAYNDDGVTMGFYDGTTVTALWNYAQNFALNDNSFGTNFGPSTPGAINLVSGQTNGVTASNAASADIVADGVGGQTLISDADPIGDTCSTSTGATVHLGGKNIGDLLNASGVSWGFFETGFNLTVTNANGTTGCKRSTTSAVTNVNKGDYIQHHQPFQYYSTTCNPTHVRPASVQVIGTSADTYSGNTNGCTSATTTANHQYDVADFYAAVAAGNFPAVSFLKAPGYQDAHAGYSDPLDEQAFVVQALNFLQQQPEWSTTAVVIAYDDSDGWYDHVTQVINGSNTSIDHTVCNASGVASASLLNYQGTAGAIAQGRCGYGPRLPLLVISPYAKTNYVDHTLTDQSSVTRFIEDNWLASARIPGSFDAVAGTIQGMFDFTKTGSTLTPTLFLDQNTGVPLSSE